jgi:hypothetical protein
MRAQRGTLQRFWVGVPLAVVAGVLGFASLAFGCTIMSGTTTITPTSGKAGAQITAGVTGLYSDATVGNTNKSQPYYLMEDNGDYCMTGAAVLGAKLPNPVGYTGSPNRNGSYSGVVRNTSTRSDMTFKGSHQICFSTGGYASWPADYLVI